jgi:hypothetical protein
MPRSCRFMNSRCRFPASGAKTLTAREGRVQISQD